MRIENHLPPIYNWLEKINLEFLTDLFVKAEINSRSILNCVEKDLIRIGILDTGYRKRILTKIEREKRKERIINGLFILIGLAQISILLLPICDTCDSVFGIDFIKKLIDSIVAKIAIVDTIVILGVFQGIVLLFVKSKIVDILLNDKFTKVSKAIATVFIFSIFYIPISGIIIVIKGQENINFGFYSALILSTILLIYLIYDFIKRIITRSDDKVPDTPPGTMIKESPLFEVVEKLEALLRDNDFKKFHEERKNHRDFFTEKQIDFLNNMESQYNDLKQKNLEGLIEYTQYNLEKNRIRKSLFDVLLEIKKNSQK